MSRHREVWFLFEHFFMYDPNSGVWLLMCFRNSNQMCVKLFSCAEGIRSKDPKCVNMHQYEDKHVMENFVAMTTV